MMKINYLSLYFCSKFDYNRTEQLEKDNFNYIKEYYNSIVYHNLHSIIFYDDLSDSFINKYQNHNVLFKKPGNHNIFSSKIKHIHDERFFYFLDYIINDYQYDYFVLTDIADVIIMKDVDNIELDKDKLYVGKDISNILDNKWFLNKYFNTDIYVKGDSWKVFKDKQLYNCGVICGHRKILIKFLLKMCELMLILYDKNNLNHPIDMYVFNYVLYKYFNNNIYLGDDFITDFSKDTYDLDKCIKHK